MTQLSRSAVLGIAKETTPGTYVAPTIFIPFTKADWEDQFAELKDTSIRGNDTELQGMYQGPVSSDWSIDLLAYPDITGIGLRATIGPDTVTPGITTTVATGGSTVNATVLPSTLSIPAGSYISIDVGMLQEYAKVTAVSGTGPYNLTVTTSDVAAVGLTKAHAAGVVLVSATTHTFKQNPAAAKSTWSISVYDTLQSLGYSGAAFSDLSLKIDPKNSVMLSLKAKAFPGVPCSALVPAYTQLAPVLGWQWYMTNAGAASTRGLSLDFAIKRAVDVIHSSDGTIGPREIFQGALNADATYKTIFENQTDLGLYLNYLQQPASAMLQQPIAAGGASLQITMSQSGWYKGKRDWGGNYVQANFSISGIYNATDGGAISAVLKNFVTTAY